MAEIPVGLPPVSPEPVPIIPGGPGQSFPQPSPLIGQPSPPKPAPPLTPQEPEAEPNAGGLTDLPILAILLIALALALIASYFTDFLNWLFRTVLGPFSGGRATKTLDPTVTTQALSNAMGRAVAGIDKQMGVSFTKLSQTTGRLASTLTAIGEAIYQLAGAISGIEHNTTGIRQGQAAIRADVRRIDRAADRAEATIQAVQKHEAADSHAVHAQLTQLQHHVSHVIEPELDALRGRIPKLERGATVAWDEIKKHDELLGIGAMTGTVALALGRLGGSWIRCETNQELGKANCRSGNNDLIRKLLAGTIDVLALSDICDLSAAMVATAQTLRPGLEAFVSAENALIGCHGNTGPKRIRLPKVSPTHVYAAVSSL